MQAAIEESGSALGLGPKPPVKAPVTRRIWNWFWRGDEMPRYAQPIAPEREALRLRARVTADVARRIEQSAEPFEGSVDAILCELYRESSYWSRSALALPQAGAASASDNWPVIAATLEQRTLPSPELLARVRRAVDAGSFQEFAALPREESASLLVGLRSLALALLNELEVNERALKALWMQRIVRVGLVCVVLLGVAFAALKVSESAEKARDLARDKPWRASSAHPGVSSCTSPAQECAESPEFFFHTQEEDHPWVQIDLGAARSFSAVRVENRRDCCTDRAAPLLVEVSSDQEHWRKVARRDQTFTSWLATFPAVTARYVRLRLDKKESFHLQRVRVLP